MLCTILSSKMLSYSTRIAMANFFQLIREFWVRTLRKSVQHLWIAIHELILWASIHLRIWWITRLFLFCKSFQLLLCETTSIFCITFSEVPVRILRGVGVKLNRRRIPELIIRLLDKLPIHLECEKSLSKLAHRGWTMLQAGTHLVLAANVPKIRVPVTYDDNFIVH